MQRLKGVCAVAWPVALVVLLAGSLTLNVYLASTSAVISWRDIQASPVGLHLRRVEVANVREGSIGHLGGSSEKDTVIYYFSPYCEAAARNVEGLGDLARQLGSSYQLVAIATAASAADLGEVLNTLPETVTVYWLRDDRWRLDYFLDTTPSTLLVDRTGRVAQLWRGAYTAQVSEAISAVLGVRLAGISPIGQ